MLIASFRCGMEGANSRVAGDIALVSPAHGITAERTRSGRYAEPVDNSAIQASVRHVRSVTEFGDSEIRTIPQQPLDDADASHTDTDVGQFIRHCSGSGP